MTRIVSDPLVRTLAALALVAPALVAASAGASMITFEGTAGDLAASVRFEVAGDDLIVTLTNTSMKDVPDSTAILTAVFFDIRSNEPLSLTPVSAVLGPGSVVHFGTTAAGGSVGGEWAFKVGLSGAPGGLAYGISSAGFGLFGAQDLFPGPNLQGPDSPNGLQYGITSAGDDLATGNVQVTGSNALIQNAVVFTLSGLPNGFNPNGRITQVSWQYGTGLREPTISVPDPVTLAVMGLGALGMLGHRVRGRRQGL